ncbi:fibrinogen-like protein A [Apostichopus japonicus]|uniref:fibrinogen-like protein A n=1 Tax=Stichopus japonicus TaxID=307972 RepID=UPI003AB85348
MLGHRFLNQESPTQMIMTFSKWVVVKRLVVICATVTIVKALKSTNAGPCPTAAPNKEKYSPQQATNRPKTTTPSEKTTDVDCKDSSCTNTDVTSKPLQPPTTKTDVAPTKLQPTTSQAGSTTIGEMSNCLDYFNAGYTTNGLYTIKPNNWPGPAFEVFCNMTDGGGWTVFQRRVNGSVDFYRNWTSYKEGFGQPDHEFWLGNDKLFYLTNQGNYQLRIDMVNRDGAPYYAKFDFFRISDESDNYRLSGLGNFNGTAEIEGGAPSGYALSEHLNAPFSTYDRDNDKSDATHCAVSLHGAWWYNNCAFSNLNGAYHASSGDASSIVWLSLPGGTYNIKYTEMKLRPI